MKKNQISVIVPVYRVEKYLDRCVQSIVDQSYDNLEIILVDDGSPDSCPAMCDKWAKKDSRIKVVHKENGGLSSARNAGTEAASGEYIVFIDSDDYWTENNFIEGAMNILEQTGDKVLLFGYAEINAKGENRPKVDFSSCTDTKSYSADFCVKNNLIVSSACTKIISRKFLLENDIAFRLGVHSEDVEWTAKIIAHNNSYSVYPKNIYAYYQNEESITHKITPDDVATLIDNLDRCIEIMEKLPRPDKNAFCNYIAYQYITNLNVYVCFAKGNKQIKKRLKKHKWLLQYHTNQKVDMIYKFNRLFGFDIMTEILYVFLKMRKTGR